MNPIDEQWKNVYTQSNNLKNQSNEIKPINDFLIHGGASMLASPQGSDLGTMLGRGISAGSEGMNAASDRKNNLMSQSLALEDKIRQSQESAYRFKEKLKYQDSMLSLKKESNILQYSSQNAKSQLADQKASKANILQLYSKITDDAMRARRFLSMKNNLAKNSENETSSWLNFNASKNLNKSNSKENNRFFPTNLTGNHNKNLENLSNSEKEALRAVKLDEDLRRMVESGATQHEIDNFIMSNSSDSIPTEIVVKEEKAEVPTETKTSDKTEKPAPSNVEKKPVEKADVLAEIRRKGIERNWSEEEIEEAQNLFLKQLERENG